MINRFVDVPTPLVSRGYVRRWAKPLQTKMSVAVFMWGTETNKWRKSDHL